MKLRETMGKPTCRANAEVADVTMPAESSADPAERICIDLRGLTDRRLDALRVMLIGDVLRRSRERTIGACVSVVTLDDAPAGAFPSASAMHELGILPTQRPRSESQMRQQLGGVPTLVLKPAVCREGGRPLQQPSLVVEGVEPPRRGGSPVPLVRDSDPLAVKLALLRFPYSSPAVLSAARIRRAAQTLDRWRLKIAGWKDQPNAQPLGIQRCGRCSMLADDLDTDQILRAMHRLEMDHTVPSGAKYRTFIELDQALAIDLHRKCGYGHWGGPSPDLVDAIESRDV